MGRMPFGVPRVPRMYEDVARMLWMERPDATGALADHRALLEGVVKIPSMLSSFMHTRKQLLSCSQGTPRDKAKQLVSKLPSYRKQALSTFCRNRGFQESNRAGQWRRVSGRLVRNEGYKDEGVRRTLGAWECQS